MGTKDYYPFGMVMQEQSFSIAAYKYGFNGKEKDDETGTQNYGMRIYNSNLGKFLSVDPFYEGFPYYSPYQFAGNKPIWAIDLDGMEEYPNSFLRELINSGASAIRRVVANAVSEAVTSIEKALVNTFKRKVREQTIVKDVSWTMYIASVGGENAKAGVKFVGGVSWTENIGGDENKEAVFAHIGIGFGFDVGSSLGKLGVLIPSGSIGLIGGVFEDAPDYCGPFIDKSGSICGLGGAYCYWPEGASAVSVSFDPKGLAATAASGGVPNASGTYRLDYYFMMPRNENDKSLDQQFKEFKEFLISSGVQLSDEMTKDLDNTFQRMKAAAEAKDKELKAAKAEDDCGG
jgi:RHS repeat-associated protein